MSKKSAILALVLALALVITAFPFAAFASTDETAVTDVNFNEADGYIYFFVETAEGYNRVKVSDADNPAGSLAVGTNGVMSGDGTCLWTIKLKAPSVATTYYFDARVASNNKYTKTYYTVSYTPTAAPEIAVTNASYTVDNGKIFFSVTTASGTYDRVMLSLASDPSKAIATSYASVTNADGTVTWSVRVADPGLETAYTFDARVAATGKYTKTYYSLTYTPAVDVEPIKSVTQEVKDGKVYFTVTTSGGFNRVKVSTADAPTGSVAVSYTSTENADGTVTWLVKMTPPSEETAYLFDVRDAATGKYMKAYFTYTFVPEAVKIISVSSSLDSGRVIFSVVTGSGYDRVMLALASAPSKAIATSYAEIQNGDGTTTWLVRVADPGAETDYSFDVRNAETGKYYKEYFAYTYTPQVAQSDFVSASSEFSGDYTLFTVVTTGAFNRVKLCLASDPTGYIKYTNDYTELENGNRQWVIKLSTPDENTDYVFDGRLVSTNKYAKDYFAYSLTLPAEEEHTIISANASYADEKVTFTVVTSDRFNRVKVSVKGDTGYLAYTNNYTTLANGNRQWTLVIDEPYDDVTYTFDARLIATNKYSNDTFDLFYEGQEKANCVENTYVTVGSYYISVIVLTDLTPDYVVFTYDAGNGTVTSTVSNYSLNSAGNMVFALTVPTPSVEVEFTMQVFANSSDKVIGNASALYYPGMGDGIDHEVI